MVYYLSIYLLFQVFNLKLLSTYALRGDKYKIQSLGNMDAHILKIDPHT